MKTRTSDAPMVPAGMHGNPRERQGLSGNVAERDCSIDAEYVIYRLEEAGATLLALPGTGWTTRLRSSSVEIVRTALEAYGWEAARIRPGGTFRR